MTRISKLLRVLCVIATSVLVLCGCESSGGGGGGGLGSGHDFGSNDPNVLLAYGDSITFGTGLTPAESYPLQLQGVLGTAVINAGVPGRKANEGAAQVNSNLNRYKPGYILILFGANDIVFKRSSADILQDLRTIVAAARNNQTIPIIATLTPTYDSHAYMQGQIEELNPLIKQMAKEEGIRVADLDRAFGDDLSLMQEDGLHPTASGAGKIAQIFGGIVQ